MNIPAPIITTIQAPWLNANSLSLDILRLDELHPVVSGNKYFKLKHYLIDAIKQGKNTVATFGGAWSNHILATAYACKEAGLSSIGIIRGERPKNPSTTITLAAQYGMELLFVDRTTYRNKEWIKAGYAREGWYWVEEGGMGNLGVMGSKEILRTISTDKYSHIVVSVGTGTTMAGLITSALPHQFVVGVSSMKANTSLDRNIQQLLIEKVTANWRIFHEYHFGGYGKHPQELIDFINEVFEIYALPLDIIYTGKTFFAIRDLVNKNYFPPQSKILMVHTGGLQGNKSLAPGVLHF